MSLPLFAFVAFALASLILALPRSKGCLAELTRLLALIGGVVAPMALLWPQPETAWVWIGLVVLIVPLTAALALAAVAWQMLIQGVPKKIEGIEEQVDLSLFDPTQWFSTEAWGGELESCLSGIALAIALMILGGLFWVGLQLAGVATRHLMLAPTTPARRVARIALGATYGTALFAGAVWWLVSMRPR